MSGRESDVSAQLARILGAATLIPERPLEAPPAATSLSYIQIHRRPEPFVPSESRASFNGKSEAITLNNVLVAGVHLQWGQQGPADLRILNEAQDIKSLELFADTIIFEEPFRVPATEVLVCCRELHFNQNGSINTTPVPHTPRKQEGRTKDDSHGQDGLDGEPAGSITVRAASVYENGSRLTAGSPGTMARLTADGSDGQSGADGFYVGDAPSGKVVPHVAWESLTEVIRSFIINNNPDEYKFPEGLRSRLQKKEIVHVNFLTVDDSYVQVPVVTATWLPGGTTSKEKLRIRNQFKEFWEAIPDGRPVLSSGRDARPGGKSGNGGAAGKITAPNVNLASAKPGKAADPTLPLTGEAPQSPNPAYYATVLAVGPAIDPELQKWTPRAEYKDVSGRFGSPAPGSTGSEGKTVLPALNASSIVDWCHPVALQLLLAFAEDLFVHGERLTALKSLEPYLPLLDLPFESVAHYGSHLQLLGSIIVRLQSNLDFFGNPPGWLPRLNATSVFEILDKQLEPELRLLAWSTTAVTEWGTIYDQERFLSSSQDALRSQQDQIRNRLAEAETRLRLAKDELRKLDAETEAAAADLESLRNTVFRTAMSEVEQLRFFQGVFGIAAGLARMCPVGQPYLGTLGATFESLSTVTIGRDANVREELTGFAGKLTDSVGTYLTENAELFQAAASETFWKDVYRTREGIAKLDDQIALHNRTIEAGLRDKAVNSEHIRNAINAAKAELDNLRDHPIPNVVLYKKKTTELASRIATLEADWTAALDPVDVDKIRLQRSDYSSYIDNITARVQDRNADVSRTLQRVKSAAQGAGDILKAIGSLSSPIRSDDPDIQSRIDAVLQTEPRFAEPAAKITRTLQEISRKRGLAASAVVSSANDITDCISTLSASMSEMLRITEQRQVFAARTLGPEMLLGFESMKRRSRRRLTATLNAFVGAWRYEYLSDVPSSVRGLDLFLSSIVTQRLARVGTTPGAFDIALDRDLPEAKQFLQNSYLDLANQLITYRLKTAARTSNTLLIALDEAELASLRSAASIRMNFVIKGLLFLNQVQLRILDVTFRRLKITTRSAFDVVQIAMMHSGESLIYQPGHYYLFRKAHDDDPIAWLFRYQNAYNDGTTEPWRRDETDESSDPLLAKLLRKETPLTMREYPPSGMSDYFLSFSRSGELGTSSDAIISVDECVLEIKYQHRQPRATKARPA